MEPGLQKIEAKKGEKIFTCENDIDPRNRVSKRGVGILQGMMWTFFPRTCRLIWTMV